MLSEEFETLVNRLMNRWAIPEEWFAPTPRWEVTEAEKEVVYRLPLPGFELAEIVLSVIGNEMTVRAEHRPPENARENREERRVELTVVLPPGLELERMEAAFRNGVLEVHIPRSPGEMPRRIEIKT
jgi:HSP20 family protein